MIYKVRILKSVARRLPSKMFFFPTGSIFDGALWKDNRILFCCAILQLAYTQWLSV